MHSGLQYEESLSFLEKNLDEHFEKKYILDEPSCRVSMKNSGKQKDDEKKRKLKT